ncbi:hypothetical protein [Ewingella americana]|uniref:Uncharacterized protein n=1 Tax=Ewingella americana TaxID=41202 RepID=A0A502G4A9_9GAMM|nr:hypothetical protein [Ewingella americana]TPG56817.1 hypothetical protein EAH77_22350 [Ewingella americana]
MQYSVLKTGAGACWTTVRLLIDILVIGPVLIFSLLILFSAWPSPGAFMINQAEGLVRGAEPGKVWGCAPIPDMLEINQRAIPQPVKPLSPYFCLPEQVGRETYATSFNHTLIQLYGMVTTLYAFLYFALRMGMKGAGRKDRAPLMAMGVAVHAEGREKQHE